MHNLPVFDTMTFTGAGTCHQDAFSPLGRPRHHNPWHCYVCYYPQDTHEREATHIIPSSQFNNLVVSGDNERRIPLPVSETLTATRLLVKYPFNSRVSVPFAGLCAFVGSPGKGGHRFHHSLGHSTRWWFPRRGHSVHGQVCISACGSSAGIHCPCFCRQLSCVCFSQKQQRNASGGVLSRFQLASRASEAICGGGCLSCPATCEHQFGRGIG